MRIVDLSVPLSVRCQERGKDSTIPQIEYVDHKWGGQQMAKIFDCSPEDFPIPGCGWAFEIITCGTHNGTHSEGKKAPTIDEMPLEYCFGDGVVLRFTEKKAGEQIDVDDVKRELDRMGYTLKPLDIVYINTNWDKKWGTPDYFYDKPGVTRAATLWLIDQGIKLMGTDSSGWDRSFSEQAKDFHRTGDKRYLWEGHFAGIEKSYYQIEKLANLDQLPDFGFKTCCIPIKVEKAGAAWARPVAFIED